MKKRLSSFIAGFLITSQLLLGCAGIASVKAETPGGSGTENVGDYLQGNYIKRISIASDGTEGNNVSLTSSLSGDGRYVAFESASSNLVSGDTNGKGDAFVYDAQTGHTERVSISSDGVETRDNGGVSDVKISPSGRYVAFSAYSSTLVPKAQASNDVYIRDRLEGKTILLNTSAEGVIGNGDSLYPSFGSSEIFVVFVSYATNLVPGDNNNKGDVFIRNLKSGEIERVSVASDGSEGNGDSSGTSSVGSLVSSDGRFVIFESSSTNLIAGENNIGRSIYIRDRIKEETKRIPLISNDNQIAEWLSISEDGNTIVFSSSLNLTPGDNDFNDIFVYDVPTGVVKWISRPRYESAPAYHWYSGRPSVSEDGRFVVFDSTASDLIDKDQNGKNDVFVYDLSTDKIMRVSVAEDGTEFSGNSNYSAISGDGKYVSFASTASDIVLDDNNNKEDIFLMKNPLYPAEVSKTQCSDGIDNDGDGPIDAADGDCHTDLDASNINSYNANSDDEGRGARVMPTPTELKQANEDGSEAVIGEIINEGLPESVNSVILSAKVEDPDGRSVAMEVQVANINESGNLTWSEPIKSHFIPSGGVASSDYYPNGGLYSWRARTIDELGSTSDWVEFGNNNEKEADFISSNFSFIFLTDVHLGSNLAPLATASSGAWTEGKSYPRFTDVLYKIEKMNIKPDFILIGGDNVEYNDERWLRDFKFITDDFSERTGIKIYFVPGNHDRYNSESTAAQWGEYDLSGGNDNLVNFLEVMGNPKNANSFYADSEIIDSKVSEPQGLNKYNYYFEHDGFQFIGLDSGEDTAEKWDNSPEGSGLSEGVFSRVKLLVDSNPDIPRVIFMHHPIYNGGEDPAYYEKWGIKVPKEIIAKPQTRTDTGEVAQDAAITNNWKDFVNYCNGHNIQIVLSGHEHNDPIFDKDGYPVTLSNWTEAEDEEYPLYVQTQSSSKDDESVRGYRIIDVNNGKAIPRESETNVTKYEKVYTDLNIEKGNSLESKIYNKDGNEITTENSGDDLFVIPTSSRKILYKDTENTDFELINNDSSEVKYSLRLQKRIEGGEPDVQLIPTSIYVITNWKKCGLDKDICLTGAMVVRKGWNFITLDFKDIEIDGNSSHRFEVDWGDLWNFDISRVKFGVNGDFRTLYVSLKDFVFIDLNSPGELRAIDKNGNVTGLVDGEIVENIPYSVYVPESETVYIFGNTRQEITEGLKTQVVGSYEATYDLSIGLSEDDQEKGKFMADDVLINGDTTHQFSVDWAALEREEKGVKMEFDENKDDHFEKSIFTDESLSFPKADIGAGVENFSVASDEGTKITFDGSGSSDVDGNIVLYEWDFKGDGAYVSSTEKAIDYAYGDDFAGKVFLRVTDDEGLTDMTSADVKINNVAPMINNIEDKNIEIADSVNLETSFTDAGTSDTHTASINWGDGTAEIDITPTGGNLENISSSHTYSAAGNYTATLSVKDDDGAIATKAFAVTVTKRMTTLLYDGETAGRYGDTIKLSAILTDKLGGLADKNVTFLFGSQTIPVLTDSNGKATAEININLIMDTYPIKVTFQEDGIYFSSETQTNLTIKSIKQIKQDASIKLKTLSSLLGQKGLEKSSSNMQDALAGDLWEDDFHLDTKHGNKVFDNEKQVVKDILKLTKGGLLMDADIKAELQSVIDDIIFSDEALINTAIIEARNMTAKTPKYFEKQKTEIIKSEASLTEALQKVTAGDTDKAIDGFKKAWSSVQLAIEFALK